MDKSKKYPWTQNNTSLFGYTQASRDGAYCKTKWLKLREIKLRESPLCVECLKTGKIIPATTCDHIIAIDSESDPLFYDYDNIQTLCNLHHRQKTKKDNSRFSDKKKEEGRQLMNDLEN